MIAPFESLMQGDSLGAIQNPDFFRPLEVSLYLAPFPAQFQRLT
jgi:hypothetical protein